MKKKFLLGLSILAFIALGLVPYAAALRSITPHPPPPLTPTLSPKGPEYQGLSQLDGPMATSTPSSSTIGEGTLPQQPPMQGNEQNFPIPTRTGHAHGERWVTYTDANFGFSFSYPANWEMDVPTRMESAKLPDYGYLVTVRNFNNAVAKRDLNPQEIKIDLWLFPKPEKYSTLEEWITNRPLFAPGTSYSGIERTIMPARISM